MSHLCQVSDAGKRVCTGFQTNTQTQGIARPHYTVWYSIRRDWFSFEVPGSEESPFDTLKAIRIWRNLIHQHTPVFFKRKMGGGKGLFVCLFVFKTCLSLQELLHSSGKWDTTGEFSREKQMPQHAASWTSAAQAEEFGSQHIPGAWRRKPH